MMKTVAVHKDEVGILSTIFKENQYDIVVMRSVLEGHSGHAYCDCKYNPSVARLDSGAYSIFGGNANSSAASELIRMAPIKVVTPENKQWEDLLIDLYKGRISYQPFCRLLPQSTDKENLTRLATNIGDDFRILKIDKELATQLPHDIQNSYFFEHFISIDDFLLRGIGYCAVYGNRIVSAVTSMAASDKMINTEIETHFDFRNKKLGTAVSASLLLYCMKHDIEAQWLAANEISEKLALKLGYVKDAEYRTLLIN